MSSNSYKSTKKKLFRVGVNTSRYCPPTQSTLVILSYLKNIVKPDEKSQQGSWRIFFRVLPKISSLIFIDSQWEILSQRQFSAEFFSHWWNMLVHPKKKSNFQFIQHILFPLFTRKSHQKWNYSRTFHNSTKDETHFKKTRKQSSMKKETHIFFVTCWMKTKKAKRKKRRFRFAATAPAPHDEYHQLPQGAKASNQSHHHH